MIKIRHEEDLITVNEDDTNRRSLHQTSQDRLNNRDPGSEHTEICTGSEQEVMKGSGKQNQGIYTEIMSDLD